MEIECKYKYQNIEKFNGEKYCLCFNDLCKNLSFACDKNCQIFEDYKQLQQYKQCLDEIKHILEVNKRELDECLFNDIDGQILQKIKEVKGNE